MICHKALPPHASPAAGSAAAAGSATAPRISSAPNAAAKAQDAPIFPKQTNEEIPQPIQAGVIAKKAAENLQEEPQCQPEKFHMQILR